MRLGVVLVFLIMVACGGAIQQPARASSLLHDIEKGIKRIDRQLCANTHSAKCKTPQTKSGRVRKLKASPAAPAAAPSKAVPVTPSKPSVVVSPLPKPRPIDLNSDLKLQPAAPAAAPKLAPVVAPPPAAKPTPPVVVPSKVLPITPLKPSVAPLPKARPADLNSGPKLQPAAPALAQKPAPVEPSPALTKSLPPVAVVPAIPPVPPPTTDQASTCLAALAAAGTSFAPVPQPETSPACQVDTPVRLNSFATKAGVVKLPDQPIFKCAFALKLSQFVDEKMQPLALQSTGSTVVAMGTGPGFNCRGRNGDSSAKMSEHAIGDAVDIEYIKLANKSQIQVKDALNVQSPSFAFLRDLRASACTEFTTVLGPGANAAHAEHFHLDLEVRRGGFRLCE